MKIFEFDNVKKSFGEKKVLDGLTFSVGEGEVFGFLGQNGAGKTTAMKTALGLLRADGGEVRICGERVEFGNSKTNRVVGYLPDVPEYYSFMTSAEYLAYCGALSGMSRERIGVRVPDMLAAVGLDGEKRRIRGFSRGMKQRLGIAQALLAEPRLLLCDEPTSALDPIGRREILDLLSAVKGKTTVVFSTHILSDAERICDEVVVLKDGHIVLSGGLKEIRESHRTHRIAIELRSESELNNFAALPCIVEHMIQARGSELLLGSDDIETLERQVLNMLSENSVLPVRFELAEPTLESLFTEAVNGKNGEV